MQFMITKKDSGHNNYKTSYFRLFKMCKIGRTTVNCTESFGDLSVCGHQYQYCELDRLNKYNGVSSLFYNSG